MPIPPEIPDDIQRLGLQWWLWLNHLEASCTLDHDLLPPSVVDYRRLPTPVEAAQAVAEMFSTTVKLTMEHVSRLGLLDIDSAPYFEKFCASATKTMDSIGLRYYDDIHDIEHIARARTFRPVEVYIAIATDYPIDLVADFETRLLATEVRRQFRLVGAPLRVRGARVILSTHATRAPGRFLLHSYYPDWRFSRDSLEWFLWPLIAVLTHFLDRPSYLPGAFEAVYDFLSRAQHSDRLPKQMRLTPDVTLVFCKTKIDFLVTAGVGARVLAFVDEWASESEELDLPMFRKP